MEQNNNGCTFSLPALALGIVTATLAECFFGQAGASSARSLFLFGLLEAAVLSAGAYAFGALAARCRLFSVQNFTSRLLCGLFFIGFAAELARTVWAAQTLCREQFGSNALIGALPLLVLLSWQLENTALDRAARALWWLLAAGAVACLAGVWGQMHWQRLFAPGAPSIWQEGLPAWHIYPEYFALPLLCTPEKRKKGSLLPFWGFAVQAGYAFVLELVLGRRAGPDYSGLELLRAWALGYFSRLDALLLLIWLTVALWRVCLLVFVLRALWARCFGPAAQHGCPQE